MKSLLLISHSSSLTGAPILLHDIASGLDNKKYKVRFLVGDSGPMLERFKKIGPAQVEELYPNELKYWREIKRIRRRVDLLRNIRPDLVFCNSIHTAKWLFYASMLGIPGLTHVLELEQGFRTLTGIEHLMVRRLSNRFIAASEAVKRNLVQNQGIDTVKIEVVHAGVDLKRFGNKGGVLELKKQFGLENSIIVGTVGRITHVKGSDLLLRVATKLKEMANASTPIKFLVVATTADREFFRKFESELSERGLSQDVVLVRDVADTSPFFSSMDIYVSTAREDPFPVVVLEAMASGKPVVGFAVGGIPEAVTPECGTLIEPENVDALAGAIFELIEDPVRRNSAGEAGRRRVEERFTVERYAREVEGVIERVIRTS